MDTVMKVFAAVWVTIVLALIAFSFALIVTQTIERKACNDKGGYYAGGQCIKGPVIIQ